MRTVDAAIELGLGMGAFNHLLPFPGTPLHQELLDGGRLTDPEWWLSPSYRYGDISFTPRTMTGEELHDLCLRARRRFYSFPSIGRRLLHRGNGWPPKKAAAALGINLLLRKEIDQKDGLPLGNEPSRPVPLPSSAVRSRRRVTLEFGLAGPADDAAIRDLLRRTAMPGDISLAFLREPSFFRAARAGNRESQTMVCRDVAAGEVVGLGERGIRAAYVDGSAAVVGYLSNLRGAPEWRKGTGLARGYRYLRALHGDGQGALLRDDHPGGERGGGRAPHERTRLASHLRARSAR